MKWIYLPLFVLLGTDVNGCDSTRSELAKALDYVREGDIFTVSRLDRLARSTRHLCEISEQLRAKGVSLVIIDQAIDTSTATGRLLFNMLASIAEFETEIRKERQMGLPSLGVFQLISKQLKVK